MKKLKKFLITHKIKCPECNGTGKYKSKWIFCAESLKSVKKNLMNNCTIKEIK